MIVRNKLKQFIFEHQLRCATALLNGPNAWAALERMGIPGFGTHLVRFAFPQYQSKVSQWGFGRPLHKQITEVIAKDQEAYILLLPVIEKFSTDLNDWLLEFDADQANMPYLKNDLFPLADTLLLYSFARHFKPRRYIEVGSGISTKIVNQARIIGRWGLEITSIDPEPRAFVDGICDHVIREKLEDVEDSVFRELQAGDFFFFDGSHYSFPSNDVVVFFLKILPNLPAGTIIHLHDVYLPSDYSPNQLKFMWSEQYMLACWLMGGGEGVKTIFPGAYMSLNPQMQTLLTKVAGHLHDSDIRSSSWHMQGTSYWFVKT